MMDFLSDVFEFEVDSVSESVQRGPLFFKLCEISTPPLGLSNQGVVFSFKVKSEQELKEIISKYNFFLYRKSQTNILEKIDLVQNELQTTLTISDIDHRLWRFELKTLLNF